LQAPYLALAVHMTAEHFIWHYCSCC